MSFRSFVLAASVALAGSSCVPYSAKPVSGGTEKAESAGDFPECGPGLKVVDRGYGEKVVSYPLGTSEEAWGCANDHLKERDCTSIRQEARRRIDSIPEMFFCKNNSSRVTLSEGHSYSDLARIGGLSHVGRTEGDCHDVTIDFERRIGNVLDRLECGEDGKPYEHLDFGQGKGGTVYNPCAGGSC